MVTSLSAREFALATVALRRSLRVFLQQHDVAIAAEEARGMQITTSRPQK
jgi:hypothetical protein